MYIFTTKSKIFHFQFFLFKIKYIISIVSYNHFNIEERKISSLIIKILICGDPFVGKTTLVKRFTKGYFIENCKLTIGSDVTTKDLSVNHQGDQQLVYLIIFDISGLDRFKILRKNIYWGSDGALLIFDLTRYETFNPGIKNWLEELNQILGKIPFLIIGTKADLSEIRVNDDLVRKFAEENNSIYIKTTAKIGQNIDEPFINLIERVLDKRDL
ncbi:MAG: GTP-binding protein [Promethearchaeota archaeon]|nr:MAG: GTP-binding protein [Candidatus Lokiarchaeota archaeon]